MNTKSLFYAMSTGDEDNQKFYRSVLLPYEQHIYDMIVDAWKKLQHTVSVKHPHREVFDVQKIVQYAALDNPHLFYVDYYKFSLTKQISHSKLKFNFFFHDTAIQFYMSALSEWRRYVRKSVPANLSAIDKYFIIYDYLRRQVQYMERGPALSHTILGCVPAFGHSAVCEGISKAYKYLMNSMNLPVIIVPGIANANGKSEGHAWNAIPWEGCYRYIDITKELNCNDSSKHLYNFMKTDKDMYNYSWDKRIFDIS